MKIPNRLLLIGLFPSLLFSESIIKMETNDYSESKIAKEISESLTMILDPEFQETVFEGVEMKSGTAYGGEITSFLDVKFDPYRQEFIIGGRDDLPEVFERTFAEVFVQSRLNAMVEGKIQTAEALQNQIQELESQNSSGLIQEETLAIKIETRKKRLEDLLSSLNGQPGAWTFRMNPPSKKNKRPHHTP